MKNRCQVFEKSIGLYIIVLIMLFYSCSEDKGNYDYKAVNEVIVTGVTKDTSVMRGLPLCRYRHQKRHEVFCGF